MDDHPGIPVVDFSGLSLNEDVLDFKQECVRKVACEIYTACSTIGFVYLKNHGIPQEKIDSLFKVSKSFFSLPSNAKNKYVRPSNGSGHGWVQLERERTNLERPGDLKEAFNVTEPVNDAHGWPNEEVPNFELEVRSFFQMCRELALRILTAMAIGLQVDPDIFISSHTHMEGTDNATTLRLLHYPKLPDPALVKPGQIRCGEHTDYGSITLLLQDDVGGLEVGDIEGGYIPAPPLQGTILVNIADLMQRWTSEKLKSTRHRVVIPTKEQEHPQCRYSVAFFVHPDDEALIRCLDGSDKYPPLTAGKYLQDILNEVYQY